MAAAITDRTRLIFVCTPNNPTGPAVQRDELTDFLDRVPPACLAVIDEAYVQYVRDPQVPDGLRLYSRRPNVAVLRTFSKAYGLAGLRVGYLVGHEPVAAAVRKTMLPFTVNSIAQAAAIASLAAESELLERVELVVKERDRVRHELLGQGWTVPPTEANFVWLPLGERSAEFTARCDAAGVSVRPYLPDGVRVTIADPEANDAFLAAAASYSHRA
jgi:histidinol-phosphate aminotransferase